MLLEFWTTLMKVLSLKPVFLFLKYKGPGVQNLASGQHTKAFCSWCSKAGAVGSPTQIQINSIKIERRNIIMSKWFRKLFLMLPQDKSENITMAWRWSAQTEKCKCWHVENSYRQHGFCPLPMASLQQLDAIDVVANLDQVSHQELGSPSLGPSGYLTTAHHVGLSQHCWVECPSANTFVKEYSNWDRWIHQSWQTGFGIWECVRVCDWSQGEKKRDDEQIHINVNSQADHTSECIDLRPHRLPLGYWTTMSWSSSMPHTVPVVVSVSNMPSVHPPWPCWRDWTISRSKSMLTRSPIWRPPGFRFPFCSPGRWILQKKIVSDFKWFAIKAKWKYKK